MEEKGGGGLAYYCLFSACVCVRAGCPVLLLSFVFPDVLLRVEQGLYYLLLVFRLMIYHS